MGASPSANPVALVLMLISKDGLNDRIDKKARKDGRSLSLPGSRVDWRLEEQMQRLRTGTPPMCQQLPAATLNAHVFLDDDTNQPI